MDTRTLRLLPALICSLAAAQGIGTKAAKLPVTELTAFKDGHAFVLRSGDLAPGADGRIRLDDLPKPILGTFWPAVGGSACTLRSVTAGQRRVTVARTALELRQMLAANLGAKVIVRETGDLRYEATVLELPARPAAEVEAHGGTAPALAERSDVVLLRTTATRRETSAEKIADDGVRMVRLDRIVDVTFVDVPNPTFTDEEVRPQLALDLACTGAMPATVPVQLGWIERGFRWIPSYRVVLDGKGKAVVQLQATLVNDLVDLENVTVHLVVGVPSFVGKGQLDPIALQAAITDAVSRMPPGQMQQFLSNAIQTQAGGYNNDATYSPAVPTGNEADATAGKKEQDLFVFTVHGITLKAKDRMVLSIGEMTVDYRDVWKLDVAVAPPPEVWERYGSSTDALSRLLAAPKVRHEVRLANRGPAPFTTAPALVMQGAQVLAQGTMTYTPAGSSCDLALTTAIDILVQKNDQETGRTPNAVQWNHSGYLRVDLAGKVKLANRRQQAVDVEVRRAVYGKLDAVDASGAMMQANAYDDDAAADVGGGPFASFRSWFGSWSLALNGLGRASWTVHLEPGMETEVGCTWHYFWPH
jgi:hypothetical protein